MTYSIDQVDLETPSTNIEEKKEQIYDSEKSHDFLSDGKWRGKEEPMFDLEEEKNGFMKIMDALSDEEKNCLSDINMPLRHFRAEKGDTEKAIEKVKSTILWRKEFQVEPLIKCFSEGGDPGMRKMMEFESETGKIYARGYDRDGRAILYLRPGLENSKNVDDSMKHLVYQIERAIACTEKKSGLSKYVVIVDFEGYSLLTAPSTKATKMTVEILQDRYPERLLRFYICNPPKLFRLLWKMIRPFVDPVTKEKIKFCHGQEGLDTLQETIELSTLEKCLVDTSNLRPFDHTEYLLKTPFDQTFDE